MPDSRLRVEARGPIIEIVFDNPPINIYDVATRDELCDVLAAVLAEPDVRVVVYRATGEHFSAGADLREFGTAPSLFAMRDARWGRDVWGLLRAVEVPMIASMHGNAVGFGFELALQCDYRIVADDCVVALPEARIGMIPAGGATQTLARVVGNSAGIHAILTGERVASSKALARGFVDEVVARGELRARTDELAERNRLPPGGSRPIGEGPRLVVARHPGRRGSAARGAISRRHCARVASCHAGQGRPRPAVSRRSGPRGVRQAPATRALVDAERVVRARFPCW